MAKKIAFIGAGSLGFTTLIVNDILMFPAFDDVEFALMDISKPRLDYAVRATERIIKARGCSATITATLDRAEALKGADGVCITILSGGPQIFRTDVEIPKKYGVDINCGDTRGPSGIFRYLRTAGPIMEICRDIEKYCPDAIVLNYTNPMALLCRHMQTETNLKLTGLCHSVQATSMKLAKWINADMKDVTFTCAGINHQAFFIDFRVNGKDAYPAIRKAILENPDIYNEEQVRNEMFLHLDYYVTESSGHNSEYVAWFRKRPDLIEKYCTYGTGWNPGVHASILKYYLGLVDGWVQEYEDWFAKELSLSYSYEYAANIYNAVFGDNEMFEFYGSVRNFGLIDNLPEGSCVEVPIIASKAGMRPLHVGPLPDQIALLLGNNASCEDLAVKGLIEGDRRKIYHAVLFDPLTSAVLSLREAKDMVDEMLEANRAYLPESLF